MASVNAEEGSSTLKTGKRWAAAPALLVRWHDWWQAYLMRVASDQLSVKNFVTLSLTGGYCGPIKID